VGQFVLGTIAELARGPAPWTQASEHSPSDSLVVVALTLQEVSDERDPNAPKLLYCGQAERALAHLRELLEDCTTLHTFSVHDPIHGWYQLGNWQEGVFRITYITLIFATNSYKSHKTSLSLGEGFSTSLIWTTSGRPYLV
jgi:hypothetical protein